MWNLNLPKSIEYSDTFNKLYQSSFTVNALICLHSLVNTNLDSDLNKQVIIEMQ